MCHVFSYSQITVYFLKEELVAFTKLVLFCLPFLPIRGLSILTVWLLIISWLHIPSLSEYPDGNIWWPLGLFWDENIVTGQKWHCWQFRLVCHRRCVSSSLAKNNNSRESVDAKLQRVHLPLKHWTLASLRRRSFTELRGSFTEEEELHRRPHSASQRRRGWSKLWLKAPTWIPSQLDPDFSSELRHLPLAAGFNCIWAVGCALWKAGQSLHNLKAWIEAER